MTMSVYVAARLELSKIYIKEVRELMVGLKEEFPHTSKSTLRNRAISKLCVKYRNQYLDIMEKMKNENYADGNSITEEDKLRARNVYRAKTLVRFKHSTEYVNILKQVRKDHPFFTDSGVRNKALTLLSHKYPLLYLQMLRKAQKEREVGK